MNWNSRKPQKTENKLKIKSWEEKVEEEEEEGANEVKKWTCSLDSMPHIPTWLEFIFLLIHTYW